MEDSERYTSSAVHVPDGRASHQYCGRKRCLVLIYLQRSDDVPDRRWRYEGEVVIVSLEDGDIKKAFCSRKCAAGWLNSMETK